MVIELTRKKSDIVFSLRIPDDLYAILKRMAQHEDRSINWLILRALKPVVEAWDKEHPVEGD